MPTIARMVVEMLGDVAPLRRAFASAVRDANAFGGNMRRAINTEPLVSGPKAALEGRRAAKALTDALQSTLTTQLASINEQVARGLITERAGTIAGHEAAVAYNRSLLNGIAELRNKKMLPADVHAQLVRELTAAGTDAGRAAREALQEQLKGAGSTLRDAGRGISSAGRAATVGVTLPVIAAGTFSAKEAADAVESLNKFQVIFGRSSAEVNAQLQRLHSSIPATSAQLQDQASSFGSLLQAMGYTGAEVQRMSIRLVRLGGDLTSLHNIPVEETMQRLFSGLVGETEAVRRFGVDISEARLKVLAHNAGLGDNVQALTRMQKTQLIFNEILRATSNATGDAAATSTSAANAFRFLSRDLREAGITIGARLLPTIVPLVQSLSQLIVRLSTMSPRTLDMVIKLALFAAAVGPVLIVLGALVSAIGVLVGTLGTLAPAIIGAIALLAGPAGWVLAIGAATAAVLGFIAANSAAAPTADKLANSLRGLSTAQMVNEMTELSRKIQALRQSAKADEAALAAGASVGSSSVMSAGTGGGSVGGGRVRIDPAVARLAETNAAITAMQTRLDALGIAVNRNAGDAARSAAEMEAMFKRADAAAKAMLAGMGDNGAAAAKAAAAALKAANKEQREFMAELSGTVSSLVDLHTEGVKFGQNVSDIDARAVRTFSSISGLIEAAGGKFDATTARLFNMRDALLKIAAVAEEETRRQRELAIAVAKTAAEFQKLILLTPTHAEVVETARRQQGLPVVAPPIQPITVNPVQIGRPITPPGMSPGVVQAPPTPPSLTMQHVQRALDGFGNALSAAGRSVQQQLLPIGNAARELVNPIYFFGSVLTEIASAIKPVFEPLRPILQRIARIIADGLAPVFEALAPVIDALIPVIRAVVQVLSPILTALAPLFKAFVPILEALFPIFKLVAIAATYVGQVFGIVANIVLRAVGNIIIGFGKIVEALARAIDALPFVSAKGAIKMAQGIQNFGVGLLNSADQMKALANDMAHAREEIGKVQLDHSASDAADSVDNMSDAAQSAAEALLFVPQLFRYRARLVETWNPRELPGTSGVPNMAGPTDGRPSIPVGDTFNIAKVEINESESGEDTLDRMRRQARRDSMATYGDTTRAGQMLT